MKSVSILFLSLILMSFTANVLAGENVYKATENEELFGTWILIDYKGWTPPAKIIFKFKSFDGYDSADANEPMWTAKYLISHKWTDSKGNVWYKSKYRIGNIKGAFSLYKISDSGKTLEWIYSIIAVRVNLYKIA